MAFGVTKQELLQWKEQASNGEISFLTHFWYDRRFPQYKTVTKVACTDRNALVRWGKKHGLKEEWIHNRDTFPHFDLIGEREKQILMKEGFEQKLIRLENKSIQTRTERYRS